ncbi:hypothetical protein P879_04279, partial [Paragonimus westermani]
VFLFQYSGKTGGKLFTEITVDQLLWNYHYTLLGINMKNFGIYAGRNNSIAEMNSVNTGVEDIQNVGKVLAVNGKRYVCDI